MAVLKLICADCVEAVSRLPDNSVDLFFFSPPYDNLRSYDGFLQRSEDGFVFPLVPLFTEIKRALKPSGVAAMVINDSVVKGQRTLTVHKAVIKIVEEAGLLYHDMYLYVRPPSPRSSKKRSGDWFEYVPVFKKSNDIKFNLDSVRVSYWTSERSRKKVTRRKRDGSIKEEYYYRGQNHLGRDPGNIVYAPSGYMVSTSDKVAYKHPAIFPERLVEFFVLLFTDPGDVVVDPMVGSGTTLKVALKHNRNAVGIDINPNYIEIARERLAEHVSLFDKLLCSMVFNSHDDFFAEVHKVRERTG